MEVKRCGHKHCILCAGNAPLPACSGVNYHLQREVEVQRKELSKARRLLKKTLRTAISNGTVQGLTKRQPELLPLVQRQRAANNRLVQKIYPLRKERLLREMRPEDLRALGLTPPSPKRTGKWEDEHCDSCHRLGSVHIGAALFCFHGSSGTFKNKNWQQPFRQ
jgi:hypothetical protein